MKLAILDNAAARKLAGRGFVQGTKLRYSEEELRPYVAPFQREVEVDPVLRDLHALLSGSKPRDPKIDLDVAKLLHRSLGLRRRDAAQHGLWSYFAIALIPELVRHRWDTAQTTTKDRFWRPGTRPDSNYFGRLWWIAELTKEDDSYRLTEQIFANQSLAKGIFVRKLSHHRPAVSACAKVLGARESKVVDAALRGLQKCLSVYPIAGLSESDLVRLLNSLPVVRASKESRSSAR